MATRTNTRFVSWGLEKMLLPPSRPGAFAPHDVTAGECVTQAVPGRGEPSRGDAEPWSLLERLLNHPRVERVISSASSVGKLRQRWVACGGHRDAPCPTLGMAGEG